MSAPGLEIAAVRDTVGVSQDLGHPVAALDVEELLSLITMYTTALDELAETGDPEVVGLARELLVLRSEAVGALTQLGPSGRNGSSSVDDAG